MCVIVYGGELFTSSFLGQPPSFFTSATGPMMFAVGHVIVEQLFKYAPNVLPIEQTLRWELPLATLDALTRAALLCSFSPPAILESKLKAVRDSPLALVMCGLLNANAGFFLVNTFSMLSPSGWSVQTPPELEPWGWTSLDLLVAPTITALFATLTHSQTAWRNVSVQATSYMGYGLLTGNITTTTTEKLGESGNDSGAPFDEERARAICAIILMGLFSGRAIKNFGGLSALSKIFRTGGGKIKTQ